MKIASKIIYLKNGFRFKTLLPCQLLKSIWKSLFPS